MSIVVHFLPCVSCHVFGVMLHSEDKELKDEAGTVLFSSVLGEK